MCCKFTVIVLTDKEQESRIEYLENVGEIQYIYCMGSNRVTSLNAALDQAAGEYIYISNAESDISSEFFTCVEENIQYMPEESAFAAVPIKYMHGQRKTRIRQKYGNKNACVLHTEYTYGTGFTELSSVILRKSSIGRFQENKTFNEAKQLFLNHLLEQCNVFLWINECAGVVDTHKKNEEIEKEYGSLEAYIRSYLGEFWNQELRKYEKQYTFIPYHVQYAFVDELIGFLSSHNNLAEENSDIEEIFWAAITPSLERLEDNLLIDALGMHDMPRIIHFFEKKYHRYANLNDLDDDIEICVGNAVIGRLSYQSVILHFAEIKDGVLHIEGESSIPACMEREMARIGIEMNGKAAYGKIEKRTNHKQILNQIYEYAYTFSIDYELNECEKLTVRFFTEVAGKKIFYRAITSMRFMPVSNEISHSYKIQCGYVMKMNGDALCCEKENANSFHKCENAYQSSLKEIGTEPARKAIRLREYYFYFKKRKKKAIWLFFDRIDKADDNGEAMFRYVNENEKDIADTYFIIDKTCSDYKRLQQYGKVVAANSKKHKLLLLLADYIFTSQLNGFIENPFGQNTCYYRDLYHQANVVFLQHGITKDDHTKWLNRYNQNLKGLVTSAKQETQSFCQYDYFYTPDKIWETGMPRYDELYHAEKKYILFMPTWRENLMEQRWNPELKVWQWRSIDDFKNSQYCKTYSAILSNEEFVNFCEENGYKIIFLPHPLVQPYGDCFRIHEKVEVWSMDKRWRDAFAECELMITDYSSVAFDFAYLRKPVIYYQFDQEEFFAHHTYKKGYFDYYDSGFGEVILYDQELFSLIKSYVKNQCALKTKYKERINQFFTYEDHNCCKRIIERVKECQKQ